MLFSQILPGENVLLGAPAVGSPEGEVRGGWVTRGDMYFGVETSCLGCILVVRVHVDRGCGGFTPKVHSCFREGGWWWLSLGGWGAAFAMVGGAG